MNIEQDADNLRPQSSVTASDSESPIDRFLVPKTAPEPRSFARWRFDAGYITRASNVSNVLVDATLSVLGLVVLVTSTASVVFTIAMLEFQMSLTQAALPAGGVGLLSPVVVVALIRLIDLMLRLTFLLIVAALVTGLFELVQLVLFGR